MKNLDAATIIHLLKVISPLTMFAFIAALLISFIVNYVSVISRLVSLYVITEFSFANARKRVFNRIVHDRKHALYPGSTKWKCTG